MIEKIMALNDGLSATSENPGWVKIPVLPKRIELPKDTADYYAEQ